ncbi:signal peptidase I [Nocardioides anomalus]|uniref:Signal peptidase I n=1 Tax=Nocardioides anomalus TaxID=2712223 RepID=A0A6G6W9A6_9ACTN|nr:signal peptidase I [Nocardioides anomalus]QIG41789.1 signal peptidase I [Nocardioides anomalus]
MRKQPRRPWRLLSNAAVLALLGAWYFTLAPTAFGGPSGYIEVVGHSMDGTYATGDLILTHRKHTYATGDIIAFRANDAGGQVIHRITGGDGTTGYITQGDNNPDADPWHPTDDQIIGAAQMRFAGKAWVMHLPRQPWFAGLTAGLITLLVLGWDARPRRDDSPVEDVSGAVDAEASTTTLESADMTAPGARR